MAELLSEHLHRVICRALEDALSSIELVGTFSPTVYGELGPDMPLQTLRFFGGSPAADLPQYRETARESGIKDGISAYVIVYQTTGEREGRKVPVLILEAGERAVREAYVFTQAYSDVSPSGRVQGNGPAQLLRIEKSVLYSSAFVAATKAFDSNKEQAKAASFLTAAVNELCGTTGKVALGYGLEDLEATLLLSGWDKQAAAKAAARLGSISSIARETPNELSLLFKDLQRTDFSNSLGSLARVTLCAATKGTKIGVSDRAVLRTYPLNFNLCDSAGNVDASVSEDVTGMSISEIGLAGLYYLFIPHLTELTTDVFDAWCVDLLTACARYTFDSYLNQWLATQAYYQSCLRNGTYPGLDQVAHDSLLEKYVSRLDTKANIQRDFYQTLLASLEVNLFIQTKKIIASIKGNIAPEKFDLTSLSEVMSRDRLEELRANQNDDLIVEHSIQPRNFPGMYWSFLDMTATIVGDIYGSVERAKQKLSA